MTHYRLAPQRVDFVVQQWIGHDGYQLQGLSHRELDDLFTRYCQLEQEHPGVARRGESKRDRITPALEHANATQLTCLLEAILLMLPSGSATWRTPDREAQIRSWIAESKVQSVVEPESWDQATIHHEQASDVFGFAEPQRSVSPSVYPDVPDEEWFAPPQAPAPLEEPAANVPTGGWFAPQEVPTHLEEQAIRTEHTWKIFESTAPQAGKRDFFMSHAGEDKDFVRELVHALEARGASVWFDEHELMVGDSLSESIAAGLANSRYGIVVLSQNFLEKRWPRHELTGLIARELKGEGATLPIWHQITEEQVRAFDPSLVGKVALDSDRMSVEEIADALCRRLRRQVQ